MKVSGIITEYNPFHKGHQLHLDMTRKLSSNHGVVCVMSGNFVQRGEPALIDKWKRTEMALKSGVDLVLELPTVYALSSAEYFAYGSVALLDSLNVVDSICFGSESGDIEILNRISSILSNETQEFKNLLSFWLDKGMPITQARNNSIIKIMEDNKLALNKEEVLKTLNSSNNILAIEYMKALKKLNSKITPYTFKRSGGSYNSENLHENISSATSIREYLKNNGAIDGLNPHLPLESFEILKSLYNSNYDFVHKENLFPFLKYKLTTSKKNFTNIPEIIEGLDNKILKEITNSNSLEELTLNIKSKRYTYTRISRILTQLFLGFDNYAIYELRKNPPNYARVLGLNQTGAKILKSIKQNSEINLINKVSKTHDNMLLMDIQATNAYSLLCSSVKYNQDYLQSPIIFMDNY